MKRSHKLIALAITFLILYSLILAAGIPRYAASITFVVVAIVIWFLPEPRSPARIHVSVEPKSVQELRTCAIARITVRWIDRAKPDSTWMVSGADLESFLEATRSLYQPEATRITYATLDPDDARKVLDSLVQDSPSWKSHPAYSESADVVASFITFVWKNPDKAIQDLRWSEETPYPFLGIRIRI